MLKSLLLFIVALGVHAEDGLPRNTSPTGAAVYVISPIESETVKGAVTVRFGLRGMGVAPAGINMVGTGHHHLLIDVEALPPMDKPLPKDDKHLHFGAGQTETTLTLTPGKHTLQLILGDQLHIPHQPPLISKKITITVE
jgi:Domain of unknown function (DUF4399)